MAKKKDVKVDRLGGWDDYAEKNAAEALPQIYNRVEASSKAARDWYWDSIASKRNASLAVRLLSFLLLVLGAALPILAGIYGEPQTRLLFTQLGVAALAIAGLSQAADRIFGWSSGWLRYMTTATAMENVTRRFELDWVGPEVNFNK